MKKELLIRAGEAAYGEGWKSPIQRDLGLSHRQRITQWVNDERPVPELKSELLAILEVRKASIENAIDALKNDFYVTDKIDLTEVFFTVSEGGHLLDESFSSIEDAQKWIDNEVDEDDQYLMSIHQMTVTERYALETMQCFSDVYDPKLVLKAIKSEQFAKTEQEYYLDLCQLDESHLGREYYTYYIANEFNLTNNPSFNCSDDDFYFKNTLNYKKFILKRIADLSRYVAENF